MHEGRDIHGTLSRHRHELRRLLGPGGEGGLRPARGGELQLRLLLDRYSLELFVNDGEQAASFGVFTPETADGIWFEADGSALLDVEKYRLEF